jgi:trafficking protein particle complex subunit 1
MWTCQTLSLLAILLASQRSRRHTQRVVRIRHRARSPHPRFEFAQIDVLILRVSGVEEAAPRRSPPARSAVRPMTVHSFYLFDRSGTCLCYREWSRTLKVHRPVDDQKTMFGMLFALRNFSIKLSPTAANGLPKYYATDVYALHYFETPTGLRFVLTTSRDFGAVDIARHLREIYSDVFVDYVVKNPLYVRGTRIQSDLFLSKLDAYVQSLPCF